MCNIDASVNLFGENDDTCSFSTVNKEDRVYDDGEIPNERHKDSISFRMDKIGSPIGKGLFSRKINYPQLMKNQIA